jgi:hypothetical protein
MDESLVMEVWDTFREYIPDKHKEMAANQYVDFLLGKDISAESLEGFMGYDPYLDDAIKTIVEEFKELDEDTEDDDYYEDEE